METNLYSAPAKCTSKGLKDIKRSVISRFIFLTKPVETRKEVLVNAIRKRIIKSKISVTAAGI